MRILLVCFTLAACKTEAPPPPPPAKVVQAEAPASQPIKAAEKGRRSSEQCVGPFTETPVKTLKIAGKEWELKGSTLTEKAGDSDDVMVVGVIADLKEDAPDNLANIDKFLQFFRGEKVEMIFVNGDTGETKSQIANNLKRVAASGLPVGIIVGNRECRTDFATAVEEVQVRAQNVINLNQVRHIVADDAEFVTMPGYYNSAFLHCVEGCQYFDEDVASLGPVIDMARKPITLVSHGPPRQSGSNAIDRISEGTNEGDPMLTKLIEDKQIPFGIFANIHEAGGKATDFKGENIVKEGVAVESLYLNAGPGDSVKWTMNNGTESVGMAAVIYYKGKTASYKTLKLTSASAKKK